MSNKTQLQANNTQLASLIQTLQGKAAGGGGAAGGSLDTCTVTFECQDGQSLGWVYTAVKNGEVVPVCEVRASDQTATSATLENVLCGSAIEVVSTLALVGTTCGGGVEYHATGCYPNIRIFKAPSVAGAIGTIVIYNND